MSHTKEQLFELIREAIPSTDEGIVNFRALRDALAATIDYQTRGDCNGNGNGGGDAIYGPGSKRKTEEKMCVMLEKRNKLRSYSPLNGRSRQTSTYVNRTKEFVEKLDSMLDRFDGLSTKMEKLTYILKKLEKKL